MRPKGSSGRVGELLRGEDVVERFFLADRFDQVGEVGQPLLADAAALVQVAARGLEGLSRLPPGGEIQEVRFARVIERHVSRHTLILFRHSWTRFQIVFDEKPLFSAVSASVHSSTQ